MKKELKKVLTAIGGAVVCLVLGAPIQAQPPGSCGSSIFTSPVSFNVGEGPEGLTLADFNSDGINDLATANIISHDVSVQLGDGLGGFSTAVNFPVGDSPRAIVSGDFNEDGKIDLVVANSFGNSISRFIGDGAGGFDGPYDVGHGIGPFSLTTADLNNDGHLDLVTTNNLNGGYVLLGVGDFSFSQPVFFGAGTSPYAITTGDLNSDGNVDLVTSNYHSDNVSVLMGNGDGSFLPAVHFSTDDETSFAVIGDFNSDGNPDIAAASARFSRISLLRGDGAGGFLLSYRYSVGQTPMSMVTGDFNRDGILDIVTSNQTTHDISVLHGVGDGTFTHIKSFGAGYSPRWVVAGDVDRDGKPDLIASNWGANTFTVLRNACTGNLAPVANNDTYTLDEDSSLDVLAPGVLTNDTDAEGDQLYATRLSFTQHGMLTFRDNGSFLYVPQANYHGTDSFTYGVYDGDRFSGIATVSLVIQPKNDVPTANGDFAAVAQDSHINTIDVLANDTTIDLDALTLASVTQGAHGGVAITHGGLHLRYTPNPGYFGADSFTYTASDSNGDLVTETVKIVVVPEGACVVPRFSETRLYPVGGSWPEGITSADFNSDGILDIVTSLSGSSKISVILGDGIGGFGVPGTFNVNSGPMSVVSADFDLDGSLDVATANWSTVSLSVMMGDGTGAFPTGISFGSGGNYPQSVAVGDFNLDGKPDLVVANNNAFSAVVFIGNGDGTFGTPLHLATGGAATAAAVADFDLDGRPDIAIANRYPFTISIHKGDGQGGFAPQVTLPAGDFGHSIKAVDLNADGFPDLVTGNQSDSSAVFVLIGDGKGGFLPVRGYYAGPSAQAVETGDFNLDGKIDIVAASPSLNGVAVLIGDWNGGFGHPQTIDVGGSPETITKGDFDGDGKLDVATAMKWAGYVSVILNRCSANSAPFAAADRSTVLINSGMNLIPVLDNDTDPENDLIFIRDFTQGAHGSVSFSADTRGLVYSPDGSSTGMDTFTYRITDGELESRDVTVSVRILAPTAANVSISGKVLDRSGYGLARAAVTVTGKSGTNYQAVTNTFGYFVINNVPAGSGYVLSAQSKRETFASQIVDINDSVTGIVIHPSP